MNKFLKIKVPTATVTVTNSGTTTAAVVDKLTDTGGTPNFSTTVTVGDIIIDQNNDVYTVTAVDSNSVLSVDGGGVPTALTYTIYTAAGAINSRKIVAIPLDNILRIEAIQGVTTAYENAVEIYYDTPNTNADLVRIEHTSVARNSNIMVEAIQDLIEVAMENDSVYQLFETNSSILIGLVIQS